MQPVSKKQKTTALIVALIAYFVIAAMAAGHYLLLALMSESARAERLLPWSEMPAILKPFIIFMSGFAIVSAAIHHFWRIPLLNRIRERRLRHQSILNPITPEAFLLLIIYVFLFVPAANGLLFFYLGMSVSDFILFFLVSFTLTLVWSIYDLQTNEQPA